MSECKQAFDLLRNGQSSQLHTPQFLQAFLNPGQIYHSAPSKRQSTGLPPGPESKKRKSSTETPALARDLLPKPTHPNNNSPPMTTMSSSPASASQRSAVDLQRQTRNVGRKKQLIEGKSYHLVPWHPRWECKDQMILDLIHHLSQFCPHLDPLKVL